MRRLRAAVILVAVLASCGGKSKPPPTAPPVTSESGPPPAAPTNAEECDALGYLVVGDIGDGQVACPSDTEEVARIMYGIEGGLCCKPAASAP